MATAEELAALKADLRATRKSAHEEYDRALLTLASGGLALSVTLVKDMFPFDKVVSSGYLFASWGLFGIAIFVVIASFLLSQWVHEIALKALETPGKAPAPPPWISKTITTGNWVAGAAFFLGVAAMMVFAGINFNKRLQSAEEEAKKTKVSGHTASTNVAGPVPATCCCPCPGAARNSGGGTTAPTALGASPSGRAAKPLAQPPSAGK